MQLNNTQFINISWTKSFEIDGYGTGLVDLKNRELKETNKMNKLKFENDEALEFDYYLQWKWPAYIEKTLRRMLWISLVEASEPGNPNINKHTAYLRWQIAAFSNAPPSILDLLANLKDPLLLARIAENPRTWAITRARIVQ